MENPPSHHLPRLEHRFYQAFAAVSWTMNVLPPTPGWLNEDFHQEFRELLVHGCARERLVCPAYCLMPDHLHLMLLGLAVESDQLNAIKFLRVHLNRLLGGENLVPLGPPSAPRPWALQPEAHDHVLREEERKQGAFARVCFYILANPVRAELVKHEWDWPFSGTVVSGYPDLHPSRDGFWELFWKLYLQQREPTPPEPPKPN